MVVEIRNRQRRRRLDSRVLASTVEVVLTALALPPEIEVGIVLVSDRLMRTYNRSLMGKRGTTDVLAFPIDGLPDPSDPAPYLGDLVISLDRAAEEGKLRGHGFSWEFMTYLIHGFLHLIGYSDATSAERRDMETKTDDLLKRFGHLPVGIES